MSPQIHVFHEVQAGRMSIDQGMLQLEEASKAERAATRAEWFRGWVATMVFGAVLIIALIGFRAFAFVPPLEQLPAQTPAAEPSFFAQLWHALLPHLVQWVIALVMMVVTVVLLPLLKRWLTAHANTSVLGSIALKVETFAESAVASAWPVVKKDLEDASADGVITKEEMTKTVDDGLAALKKYLGENGLSQLGGALGLGGELLTQYLRGLVEAKVQAAIASGQAAAAKVVDGSTAAAAINKT